MGLYLSAPDLARLEAVSRIMVSPLASPTVEAWRASVSAAVADLFRSHKVITMMPSQGDTYGSYCADDVVDRMRGWVELAISGDYVVNDAIIDAWNQLRRQNGVNVFSWDINASMVRQCGYEMSDSEFTNYTVVDVGSRDFVGAYSRIPAGEVWLWIQLERPDVHPFGEHATQIMRALYPSFNAGLDAITRFQAHREMLDGVSEPLIVFGRGAVERYRNQALTRMLESDPEGNRVLLEAVRLAVSIYPFGFPLVSSPSPVAGPHQTVRTARGAYILTGSVTGPGVFDSDAAVLISVQSKAAPRLPPPGVLRERLGLTDREAEVALLLAEGLSNTEIADRLFLSPHTARRHTANIFEKLGVGSRRALGLRFLDL